MLHWLRSGVEAEGAITPPQVPICQKFGQDLKKFGYESFGIFQQD